MKRSRVVVLLVVVGLVGWVEPTPAAQAAAGREQRLETLKRISESLADLESDLALAKRKGAEAATGDLRGSFEIEAATLRETIAELENDFSVIASGLDPDELSGVPKEFSLRRELQEIFEPLFVELRRATDRPRELERLRGEIDDLETKVPRLDKALSRLQELRGPDLEGSGVGARLDQLEEYWSQRRNRLTSRLDAARLRLTTLQQSEGGLARSTRDLVREFVHERGRNLLFALLAFGVVYFSLSWLHRLIARYGPFHNRPRRPAWIRAADVAYYLFTTFAAVGALLGVLYLSADWVLFGLAVLMLTGIAWAARSTVPAFLDQVKLMLNMGPVREGERLVLDGIPWRVSRLSFFTHLENPRLEGGLLRLPIQELAALRSRPFSEKEPWFPCEVGDRVVLADETYGEVLVQTPEIVVLSTLLGSPRTYSTTSFLAQNPRNLSADTFGIKGILGLDYGHREALNQEIAQKAREGLEAGLREQPYGEHLREVVVELHELGSSSLDLILLAKFAGDAAPDYYSIQRKLQQIALDVANRNDWAIPFPQVTVHQPAVQAA